MAARMPLHPGRVQEPGTSRLCGSTAGQDAHHADAMNRPGHSMTAMKISQRLRSSKELEEPHQSPLTESRRAEQFAQNRVHAIRHHLISAIVGMNRIRHPVAVPDDVVENVGDEAS